MKIYKGKLQNKINFPFVLIKKRAIERKKRETGKSLKGHRTALHLKSLIKWPLLKDNFNCFNYVN